MHFSPALPPPSEVQEIWKLARELADRVRNVEARASLGHISEKAQYSDARLAIVAATISRLRIQRAKLFGAALFGEPAWDILLELFVQHARGKRTSLKSVCIGADVPLSTGLRHIDQLFNAGFATSSVDRKDKRVRIIALTPHGRGLMRACLQEAATRLELSADLECHEVTDPHRPGHTQP